jgi:hypothetical protein
MSTVLKPANRAAKLYTSGSDFQSAPRQQHQFVIVFNLYPDVIDSFLRPQQLFLKNFRDNLHFICHTVDAPNFSVVQDIVNQYNRKRVINRKVEFDPMTLRMYDTHDGLGIKFIKLLYEFEFNSARLYKKKGSGTIDVNEDHNYVQSIYQTADQFQKTHNFGLREFESDKHRLLKSIDFYQLAGKVYTKTRVVHPRLSRVDMDNFDYSSSQPVNLAMAFTYENLLFEEVNVNFEDAEYDLKSMMEETADFEDFVPAYPETEKSPALTKKDGPPPGHPEYNKGAGADQPLLDDAQETGKGLNVQSVVDGVGNVKNEVTGAVKNTAKSIGSMFNFGKK